MTRDKRPTESKIKFDLDLYPFEAVQAACRSWADREDIEVRPPKQGDAAVSIRSKGVLSEPQMEELYAEFNGEILHHALRLKVSAVNQKLRDYIVTKALISALPVSMLPKVTAPPPPSPSGVLDESLEREIDKLLAETEKADPNDDPLRIATPWEKKVREKGDKKAGENG